MEFIRALLEDAERHRMNDETIKLWSKELKEVSTVQSLRHCSPSPSFSLRSTLLCLPPSQPCKYLYVTRPPPPASPSLCCVAAVCGIMEVSMQNKRFRPASGPIGDDNSAAPSTDASPLSAPPSFKMWISEGFVEQNRSDSMPEDLAMACYAKLMATNLLQSESDDNQANQRCWIPELTRDFAIRLAQDDNYSSDLSELDKARTKVRRLSIRSNELMLSRDIIRNRAGLRSLLIFYNPMLDSKLLKNIMSRLRLLRVLDLQGTPVAQVPSSIGRLFHLRYLNLSHTGIRRLPVSIKKLKKLLFLNLNGCTHLQILPRGITQLRQLRSLDILQTDLDCMPKKLQRMQDLNTLLGFKCTSRSSLVELKDLEQIRYLDIRELDRAGRVKNLLQDKSNLTSLVLSWALVPGQTEHAENVLEDLRPPACLEQITIEGYPGHEYPGWIKSFPSGYPNLVHVHIKNSRFSTSLPPLGQLPNLRYLRISAASSIATIDTGLFGQVAFPFLKLEKLVIEEMDSLEEWLGPENDQAFSVLGELYLKKCPRLKSLPRCLQFSTALKKLVIEEADSIRAIEDLDYVTDLCMKDCPALERISSLANLKTLEIVRCPRLQDVVDVNVLQHLILKDKAFESLPGWLAPNILMNLCTFKISGNPTLLKNLETDGSERHKISAIPHVFTYPLMESPELQAQLNE